MKKAILVMAVISLMTAFSSLAQITVTSADFPEIGNLIVSAIDDVTQVDPGQPGANVVWDFSNLVPATYDSVYYISPAGAPGYQNYPEANIVSNHNPGRFPNGYNMNFWNFSSGAVKAVGDETLINVWASFFISIHMKYDPPANQLTLPFTYGSSSSQSWLLEWSTASRDGGMMIDSGRTVSHGSVDLLADAYGTLVLPDGSFPVIRVRENCHSHDSTFTWNSGSWVYESDTIRDWTQYRWYANDYGEVGLYSTGSKKGNGFTFFKSETLVGIGEMSGKAEFSIYPTPAASRITVSYDAPHQSVEILDNSGRVVLRSGSQTVIDISSLSPGLYMVRLKAGLKEGTGYLVVNR